MRRLTISLWGHRIFSEFQEADGSRTQALCHLRPLSEATRQGGERARLGVAVHLSPGVLFAVCVAAGSRNCIFSSFVFSYRDIKPDNILLDEHGKPALNTHRDLLSGTSEVLGNWGSWWCQH